jgi:hypothetical protein
MACRSQICFEEVDILVLVKESDFIASIADDTRARGDILIETER